MNSTLKFVFGGLISSSAAFAHYSGAEIDKEALVELKERRGLHVSTARGATLPQGTMGLRLVNTTVGGRASGFDKDGKSLGKKDGANEAIPEGVEYKANITNIVGEVGILDNLSAAVRVPFYATNSVYFAGKDKLVKTLSDEQKKKDSAGESGLGDVEIGALFNVYNSYRFVVSTGLGFKFATGKHEDISTFAATTGTGTNDVKARLNLDYQPLDGLWLSVEEEIQVALSTAKRTTRGAFEAFKADGKELASLHHESQGVSHRGYALANLGLGAFVEQLSILAVNGGVGYAQAADTRIIDKIDGLAQDDKKRISGGSTLYSYRVGATLDVIEYGIPVAVDLEFESPFAGKNATTAPSALTAAVKGYYRF